MEMKAVDRHLLGLKIAYNELVKKEPSLQIPSLFKQSFHDYFSEILLSTSQVNLLSVDLSANYLY